MGGSTVVIEDALAYMSSLERIRDLAPAHLYPGHGPELPDATNVITTYIEHRLDREHQIVEAVAGGAGTVDEIVAVVYSDVDSSLRAAAAYQVMVQVRKLEQEGRIALGLERELGRSAELGG